jgi:polyphosphate kinase
MRGCSLPTRESSAHIDEEYSGFLKANQHARFKAPAGQPSSTWFPDILQMIEDREIALTREGGEGYIILKMNSLEDREMINALYRASEAGVKVDLIVRASAAWGPTSHTAKNIRINAYRGYLSEHARICTLGMAAIETNLSLFGRLDGTKPAPPHVRSLFLSVYSEPLRKRQIIDILKIQLSDNRSAVLWVDEHLNNLFKREDGIT